MHASKVRAVLLDLDDTLTDRLATVRKYAVQLASDFSERLRSPDVRTLADELARFDRNGYNRNRASDLAVSESWVSSPGPEALAEHWRQHFAIFAQAREGMLSTIDVLVGAGVRLAIVTNGPTEMQSRTIEAIGLRDRVRAILISEEFGAAKPDQAIFHAAASRLGVRPEDCLFVGDNPEKDVLAAAAVGMRAVWFRATMPWPEHLPPPRESIGTISELLDLPGLHY
jgi:putative hydrolase of the HAD superfamily